MNAINKVQPTIFKNVKEMNLSRLSDNARIVAERSLKNSDYFTKLTQKEGIELEVGSQGFMDPYPPAFNILSFKLRTKGNPYTVGHFDYALGEVNEYNEKEAGVNLIKSLKNYIDEKWKINV